MSIYRFKDSPISSIAFHYVDGLSTTALIEASGSATPEQIAAANKALADKGMSLVPVTVDERDMLQISGFLGEQAVLDALRANNSISGTPEITREASDSVSPKGKSFLKDNSLRLAGGLNLVGDVMMHLGGYSKVTAKFDKATGRPFTPAERKASIKAGTYDLVGGGLYTLGGLNAATFGNSKSDASPIAERTANFIAHTVNPQAVPLEAPKKPDNFFRRHTADVTLGAYTLGAGVFLAHGISGYRGLNKKLLTATAAETAELLRERKESASLIGYGASSLVFKLLSLFIKEKPKLDEDVPKSSNPVVRVKDWFVAKPLRIFGLGSFITDSFYAKHAYDTYRRVKGTPNAKSSGEYMLKAATTVSYFSSDLLAAISSKNLLVKQLTPDEERGIIALAAKSIAEQPQEKRDELISRTAHFLSNQPEIQDTAESIAVYIREQMKHSKSNPWTARVTAQVEQEAPMAR